MNLISTTILLFTLIAGSASSAASTPDFTGNWSGELRHRGDALGIRVQIGEQQGQISARLDIPSLVYARQPMKTECCNDDLLSLEFPFGIGSIHINKDGEDTLHGQRADFSVELTRTGPMARSETEIQFGAEGGKLSGQLTLPLGDGPHTVVVVIGGSGNASRSNWSYSSWADYYLNQGFGSFIYDRWPDSEPRADGALADIDDHAADVLDAMDQIRKTTGVDTLRIGLAGHSRGAWIAVAAANQDPAVAFLILVSPAAATPGEQETTSVLTGMRQDGLSDKDISDARAYLRLYFYVAGTGQGWELLASAIDAGADTNWLQYVDQPRSLDDLRWWKANMNFAMRSRLAKINAPVLALWGGNDFITPWAEYQQLLESVLHRAGNRNITSKVYASADHRLEIVPGEDKQGHWHWFGLAPGALDDIGRFLLKQPE